MSEGAEIPRGIHYSERDGVHEIRWSNRDIKQYTFYQIALFLFWLVWMAATVMATLMLLVAAWVPGAWDPGAWFLVFWLFFGWWATIGIFLSFLRRFMSEEIVFDGQFLSVAVFPFGWRRERRVALDALRSVTLEHFSSGDGPEAVVTLNVFYQQEDRSKPKRIQLACLAHPEVLSAIFRLLQYAIQPHRERVEFKDRYTPQPGIVKQTH
ncbi:MAG: hypothetical protein K8T25_15345 [Planctomycetia bacterium]|nr:hypothetical protein [Planctomycetia bacterium]